MDVDWMTPQDERAYWDAVATDPDRVSAELYSDLDLDECLDAVLIGLRYVMEPQASIMELGCGVGRLLLALAERYPKTRFLGIDSSKVMIESIDNPENVAIFQNDGRTLEPWTTNAFDGVYSMTMFQHIPNGAKIDYLRETYRVLKRGGLLRLQWSVEGEPGPLSHPLRYETMLRWLDREGFSVEGSQRDLIKPGWAWITAMKP